MNIAAVVPVWNGREHLERLIGSLERQTRPAGELIVVDNGSTDGAPQLARLRGARVIPMGTNAGFAPAVNRGIRECRAPWIAVLNSDVELAPDYFEKLEATGAPFTTGKLLQPDSTIVDGTFDAVSRAAAAWRVGSGRADGPGFSQRQTIFSAPFTAALFRAETFHRVGPLEERFESYLEDVDFGLRCAALGVQGVYEPAAVAWHRGSATLGRWHPDTVRRIARNRIFLLARHYPSSLLMRWLWPILIGQLLWGGVALRHATGFAWVHGVIQGLSGFRQMRKTSSQMDETVLIKTLSAQERVIRDLQRSNGYDAYWRLYFLLTGGGA